MKLRVRSQETKETLKMEVPNSCTLQQFKQLLSQQISPSSSSSSSSSLSSIAVSLNRKDELCGRPDESLQTLGITSGDLIFYSINSNTVTPQTLVPNAPNSGKIVAFRVPGLQEMQQTSKSDVGMTEFGESETLASDGNLIHGSSVRQQVSELNGRVINLGESETLDSGKTIIESETMQKQELSESDGYCSSESDMDEGEMGQSETVDPNTLNEETVVEGMDIEQGSGSGSAVAEKRFSVPCFLRKVLKDELADDGSDHRLLVIALHAVLLDSGFVAYDSMSNTRVDRFHLPDEWPSTTFTMSLWYTLPVLIDNGSENVETVVLKLENLGQFMIVYGSLGRNGSQVHKVCLNEYRYAPTIDLVWASKGDSAYETSSNSYPENIVFEFWKIVKDGLALPLLIDLCDRAGLNLPPCLMRLPTELKLKILELLPGVDLAKVGCVCSELGYLSSNDLLWKQKFIEEFGDVMTRQAMSQWKAKFASSWERGRKEKKRPRNTRSAYPSTVGNPPLYFLPFRRDPDPFSPLFVAGERDLWPGFGPSSARRTTSRSLPRQGARHTFSPNCNLGRFSP